MEKLVEKFNIIVFYDIKGHMVKVLLVLSVPALTEKLVKDINGNLTSISSVLEFDSLEFFPEIKIKKQRVSTGILERNVLCKILKWKK